MTRENTSLHRSSLNWRLESASSTATVSQNCVDLARKLRMRRNCSQFNKTRGRRRHSSPLRVECSGQVAHYRTVFGKSASGGLRRPPQLDVAFCIASVSGLVLGDFEREV